MGDSLPGRSQRKRIGSVSRRVQTRLPDRKHVVGGFQQAGVHRNGQDSVLGFPRPLVDCGASTANGPVIRAISGNINGQKNNGVRRKGYRTRIGGSSHAGHQRNRNRGSDGESGIFRNGPVIRRLLAHQSNQEKQSRGPRNQDRCSEPGSPPQGSLLRVLFSRAYVRSLVRRSFRNGRLHRGRGVWKRSPEQCPGVVTKDRTDPQCLSTLWAAEEMVLELLPQRGGQLAKQIALDGPRTDSLLMVELHVLNHK